MSEMDIDGWVGILLPQPVGPDVGETSTKYHPGPVVTLGGVFLCQMATKKAVASTTGDVYILSQSAQVFLQFVNEVIHNP